MVNNAATGKPLVTIGIPVYNGGDYFRETLTSILAQDYANLEFVILDNASTDGTQEVCQEFARRDARIRYKRRPKNLGAIRNWNQVVGEAKGSYLLWAPAHDLWDPSCVAQCVGILEADPSLVLCYPGAVWIDVEGKVMEAIPSRIATQGLEKLSRLHVVMWALENCYPVHGLWRLEALRRSRLFTNTFGPDALLLVEMAMLGGFASTPEPLFYLRRMPYEGDFNQALERLLKRAPTRGAAWRLYLEFLVHYVRAATRQTNSLRAKMLVAPLVLACALTRYGWVLKGLLAAAPSKTDS